MSTDFSIKPVGTPMPPPVAQPQTRATSNAVATQLPASRSVTAAGDSAAANNDPQSLSLSNLSQQSFLDYSSRTTVFEMVNKSTGQVVEQSPSEAVLRRIAYLREADSAKSTLPKASLADVKA